MLRRKRWGSEMAKLTPTQFNVLRWLADADGRALYGPMSNGMGGADRYGFAGGGPASRLRLATGNALKTSGFIAHAYDKYPLGYFTITDEGREALAKENA